jgi:signal transduction histidine kinase
MEQNPDLRILVLARVGRDSELLCAALHRHGFTCTAVSSQDDIFHELKVGAAAAIVTEESLNGAAENWGRRLQAQPAWSDLPVIVLTGAGGSRFTARSPLYRSYSSITLLERPVGSEILVSAVEAAMRARLRQYEVRDYMNRQAESQDALRRTEKLAVAGRMAASIAHEINNPLAAVTNVLYLISTSTDLESVRKYNAIAQEELRRISDIANQTLRFYRAPNPPERVKVSEVTDSALALFRAKMRNQNIKVHRD